MAGLTEEVAGRFLDRVRPEALLAGGALAGSACGVLVGYRVAKRRIEARLIEKFNVELEEELSKMRDHYREKFTVVEEQKPDLQTLVEHLKYAPEEQAAIDAVASAEEDEAADAIREEIIKKNVFDLPVMEEWDYAEEIKNRRDDVPYIIHVDEFTAQETSFEQHTLTYFEGDDVLCNQLDTPIENVDELVGVASLGKFGHGSNDGNIVYVRNMELELEFEIVHSDGDYAHEVHGIPPEDHLQHSDRRRRFDDE